MSLKPYSKLPELNTANVLLVENEEEFHKKLSEAIVRQENNVNVTVRLARCLPLPVENAESRPRIDLVVFIVHLRSEQSLLSAEASLKHLDSGYFLGKVCFLVTGARSGTVCYERLASIRKTAASLNCPLLMTEDKTTEGVHTAAQRVLNILKVSAGLVPMASGLYLSTLIRCTMPTDSDWQNQD
ncbi:centromere protein M [Megalops cyprinoides]|uniref:centromere protein M n=1 Tax=Megalops cyprinoides TaxID=118141 RepID=UPI0018648CC7|nr:centromere protein M [Megalops cyprinoides]